MSLSASFWKRSTVTAVAVLAGSTLGWMLRPVEKTTAPPVVLTPSGKPAQLTTHGPLPQTLKCIAALRQAGRPSAQIAAAVSFSLIDSVAEIRDLLDNRHLFSDLAAETMAVQALLKRWLELEPETAMEYCRLHCPDSLRDMLSSFALTHPAEAGSIVDRMPEGTAKVWAWKRVCLGVAETNPAAAWEMLQRHPKEGEHDAARIAGKLADRNLPDALARLEGLPKPLKGYAEAQVAIAFMKADPEQAWDWIKRQPDPVFMMNQTISHVMDTDPDKAFALLASLTPEQAAGQVWGFSGNRREGFARIAEALARSPLDDAAKLHWAKDFFRNASYRDPAGALAWWPQLDAKTQEESLPGLLTRWIKDDPAAAQAWREKLPDGPLRDAAGGIPSTAESADPVKNNTPAALAREIANIGYISPDDARIPKLTSAGVGEIMAVLSKDAPEHFAKTMAQQNPVAMKAWLEQAELTNETGPHAARFLAEWAREAPAEAAAWVTTLPTGPVARTAAANVARQYALLAPEAARQWIDSLTPGPVQEAARKALSKP